MGNEEINRRQAAYRAKRDANEEARKLHLQRSQIYMAKHRYGATADLLVTIAKIQNNRCFVCKKPAAPDRKSRLHIDHDHKSGLVRGLLCNECNLGLGFFNDDPERLRAALRYLKAPPGKRALRLKRSR